uniref:Secreted protein n=1 Tax=Anguilla anguilla TaxID=7936 RepID=A0A0E9SJZ5_ANGAN
MLSFAFCLFLSSALSLNLYLPINLSHSPSLSLLLSVKNTFLEDPAVAMFLIPCFKMTKTDFSCDCYYIY